MCSGCRGEEQHSRQATERERRVGFGRYASLTQRTSLSLLVVSLGGAVNGIWAVGAVARRDRDGGRVVGDANRTSGGSPCRAQPPCPSQREREKGNKANKTPKPLGDSCHTADRVESGPLLSLISALRCACHPQPGPGRTRDAQRVAARGTDAHTHPHANHTLSHLGLWLVVCCNAEPLQKSLMASTAPLAERPFSKTQLFCSNLPWSVNGKVATTPGPAPDERTTPTHYNLHSRSASPLCATLRVSLLSLSRARVSPPAADAAPGL